MKNVDVLQARADIFACRFFGHKMRNSRTSKQAHLPKAITRQEHFTFSL